MDRTRQIWKQLEEDIPSLPGLKSIRYSEKSIRDIFLGIKYPETHRVFILRVPISIGKEFRFQYEFRGLKFEKVYDPVDSKYVLLNLLLTDNQFQDIFDSLIIDLVDVIKDESDYNIILKKYANRLIKWQTLFERFRQQGLTPEEQLGLYGELSFLRSFLASGKEMTDVIKSWVGPEKQARDFQFADWGLEVKTTCSTNQQKIFIHNERQLDSSNLEFLFLYHLSVEARLHSGETLNHIVESLKQILISSSEALGLFRNKLTDSGYFENQKELYEDKGYVIRDKSLYKIEKDFPRIEQSDLREGVINVEYSIVISNCSDFKIEEEDVLKILNPYG